jgi:hypothetical protein
MIVTTYSCDRCGHSQTTDDQMWGISVHLSHNGTTHVPQHKQLWCRKCVEVVGIFPPRPSAKKAETRAPTPTLEDMLREMIREEIGGA